MPEYGDPTNARSWDNANVYAALSTGGVYPAGPADIDTDFSGDWILGGLLDGEQGFTESTSETVTNTTAWGNILIASKITDQVTTKTFTAHETNEFTDLFRNIEEDEGELIQYRRAPLRVKIAFEKFDQGRGVVERYISYNEAEVRITGDLTENETSPQAFPFTATIFPGAGGELWLIQRTVLGS